MPGPYPFAVAPQSYFNVTNLNEERGRFLRDGSYVPHFTYLAIYNRADVEANLAAVDPGTREATALQLVRASILLGEEPSEETLTSFRDLNARFYRAPNQQYVNYVLEATARRVNVDNERLWLELENLMGEKWSPSEPLVVPSDVFKYYHSMLEDIAHVSTIPTGEGLAAALDFALKDSGLAAQGWRVAVVPESHRHASTNHRTKTIRFGELYQPRSSRGLRRIVVHEVYGHAMRGFQGSIRESEGMAVVLEQLADNRFILRRAYRYLAAALAWGYGDHPGRNFREVYEIMWRVIMIRTGYTKEKSMQYAFDECMRVFRGGQPAIAGAAFLKDSLYLVGNLEIWELLARERPGKSEFKKIIAGERRLLS